MNIFLPIIFAYGVVLYTFHTLMRKYAWDYWYYQIYLHSWHWQIKKWAKKNQCRIFHRGKVCCEKCGSRHHIVIHHVNYSHLWHESLSDLQVVCGSCHRRGSGRI